MTTFEIGDEVTVVDRHGIYLTTIIAITPKGFIKTKESILFNPDGSRRGGNIWNPSSLRLTTVADLLKTEKSRLIKQISEHNWHKVSIETLRQLLKEMKG